MDNIFIKIKKPNSFLSSNKKELEKNVLDIEVFNKHKDKFLDFERDFYIINKINLILIDDNTKLKVTLKGTQLTNNNNYNSSNKISYFLEREYSIKYLNAITRYTKEYIKHSKRDNVIPNYYALNPFYKEELLSLPIYLESIPLQIDNVIEKAITFNKIKNIFNVYKSTESNFAIPFLGTYSFNDDLEKVFEELQKKIIESIKNGNIYTLKASLKK